MGSNRWVWPAVAAVLAVLLVVVTVLAFNGGVVLKPTDEEPVVVQPDPEMLANITTAALRSVTLFAPVLVTETQVTASPLRDANGRDLSQTTGFGV